MTNLSRYRLALGLLAINSAVLAQPPDAALIEQGKTRFTNDCASCHGADGRGDGPAAGALRTRPADLTALALGNDGEFPTEYVKKVIDGRSFQTLAHGDIEMPVWGKQYRRSLLAYSERRVQQRIQALVSYLRAIQRN